MDTGKDEEFAKFERITPCKSIKLNVMKFLSCCIGCPCFRPSREEMLFIHAQRELEKDMKV